MLKYKYIFQKKYTEAILSNRIRKLLWFEITKVLIAVKNKYIVSFTIIFGTLSFRMAITRTHKNHCQKFESIEWNQKDHRGRTGNEK